jgi:hypothetical protein
MTLLIFEIAAMKHELKGKGEKTWPWKKSRKSRDHEPAFEKHTAAQATEGLENAAAAAAQRAPQETELSQTTEAGNGAAASGAVADSGPTEPLTRSESKLKTWFSKLGGRRPSESAGEAPKVAEGEHEGPSSAAEETTQAAERSVQAEEEPVQAAAEPVHVAETPVQIAEDNHRGAPLRSNPVTADDLHVMQRNSIDQGALEDTRSEEQATQQKPKEGSEQNGDMRSRLKSRLSQMASRNTQGANTHEATHHGKEAEGGSVPVEHTAADELPPHTLDRDELRKSATDQGLPAPPAMGKRTSNGTSRESRFSEDL